MQMAKINYCKKKGAEYLILVHVLERILEYAIYIIAQNQYDKLTQAYKFVMQFLNMLRKIVWCKMSEKI